MKEAESIVVAEVSMQEWAMLAFRAERAPRRVAVRARMEPEDNPEAPGPIGGARTIFWVLLAAAASTPLLFL